jgi:predicted dinucleotide-binding enzyme
MTTRSIAVIGTGRMGRALSTMLAAGGHNVYIGSRTAGRGAEVARELGHERIHGTANADAVQQAQIVFLAYHSDDDLAAGLAPHLAGKIVVDISTYNTPDLTEYDGLDRQLPSSRQEETQRRVPGARVVGAFQTVFFQAFAEPEIKGRPIPVFVTSDDQEARQVVLELIATSRFAGVDAGELANAGKLSNLFALAMRTGDKYGRFAQGVDWRVAMELIDSFILTVMDLQMPDPMQFRAR